MREEHAFLIEITKGSAVVRIFRLQQRLIAPFSISQLGIIRAVGGAKGESSHYLKSNPPD
jgi:hypothetical protein